MKSAVGAENRKLFSDKRLIIICLRARKSISKASPPKCTNCRRSISFLMSYLTIGSLETSSSMIHLKYIGAKNGRFHHPPLLKMNSAGCMTQLVKRQCSSGSHRKGIEFKTI